MKEIMRCRGYSAGLGQPLGNMKTHLARGIRWSTDLRSSSKATLNDGYDVDFMSFGGRQLWCHYPARVPFHGDHSRAANHQAASGHFAVARWTSAVGKCACF